MNSQVENTRLLEEAKSYLENLSPQKLQVAIEFLGYLQQKEGETVTLELANISTDKQESYYRQWDEQLEQNIADGKLEALAQEAISDFESGNCREI